MGHGLDGCGEINDGDIERDMEEAPCQFRPRNIVAFRRS